jgi:signal transduction histidine kinase
MAVLSQSVRAPKRFDLLRSGFAVNSMHVVNFDADKETKHQFDPVDETVHDRAEASTSIDKEDGRRRSREMRTKERNSSGRSVHIPVVLVSCMIFCLIAGSGIALSIVFSRNESAKAENEAMETAGSLGTHFSDELDRAILPLFSIAQFATEIEIFAALPSVIGPANEPESLPYVLDDNVSTYKRNVTGVCDDPILIERFNNISKTIKEHAQMNGTFVNIQLAPYGVICLIYPMNNTEDFSAGKYLDSSGVWGLDLLEEPNMRFIARESMKKEEIGIAGPRPLQQCPDCGLFFIVRLPVISNHHVIVVDGVPYPRWGFATAVINWDELVRNSNIDKYFNRNRLQFRITRTDKIYNQTTNQYHEKVTTIAESDAFGTHKHRVSTTLATTNNEWAMTVEYDVSVMWSGVTIALSILFGFCIAMLSYMVLYQRSKQTAQHARIELEHNITAYYAHELRNPLSAIDSALQSLPPELPDVVSEIVSGMRLCTSLMSSIMNNLLDVRMMEEGMMVLDAEPLSIAQVLEDTKQMALPTVHPNVELRIVTESQDWVLGDKLRIQQVMNNILSNAIKHTKDGSITLKSSWDNNSMLRLECQDTGPGIPKEEQAMMFERFVSRGKGVPGTGLGLAISKQLVGLMGGTVRFESDPSVRPGTNCIVLLPLELCEAPRYSEHTNDVEYNGTPILDPISILIVDDVKLNRVMLRKRLEKYVAPNCTILEASTGEEALTLCNVCCFSIIIMDNYMEEAGGVLRGTEVVCALRSMQVESVIIGCSGNHLESEFKAAGADLVWMKPVPSNEEIILQFRHHLNILTS